jgi:hypothetical protein
MKIYLRRLCSSSALASASKTCRIHTEVGFFAFLAAASISPISDSSTRQYSRPAREEPFGKGGLPILGFLGIF